MIDVIGDKWNRGFDGCGGDQDVEVANHLPAFAESASDAAAYACDFLGYRKLRE